MENTFTKETRKFESNSGSGFIDERYLRFRSTLLNVTQRVFETLTDLENGPIDNIRAQELVHQSIEIANIILDKVKDQADNKFGLNADRHFYTEKSNPVNRSRPLFSS